MKKLGSYEIVRVIGEGGFGITYEGRHILNPRIRACLKQNLEISDENAELLTREAELLERVHHRSLPAFRDLYRLPDQSMVLAMSYIEGKSLDKVIAKHKALDPEEVGWIAERALDALYYLHRQGIVHGDVKPSNILIQPKDHNIFLVDYGLSTIKPTSTSKPAGYTKVFSAPEVLQAKPPLPESDIYSLGLTMIYAWGGDPIAQSNPEYVPAAMQEFVKTLTHHNPLERASWEKEDLIKKLSDARYAAFGRRHMM